MAYAFHHFSGFHLVRDSLCSRATLPLLISPLRGALSHALPPLSTFLAWVGAGL